MKIRVAAGKFHDLSEERLRFAAQIGATGPADEQSGP